MVVSVSLHKKARELKVKFKKELGKKGLSNKERQFRERMINALYGV